MDEKTRQSLSNPSTWTRGAVMLLFFVLLAVVTPLLVLVSLVGWIGLLFNGRTPEPVVEFGQSLADWYARTARYLTGNARRRPFPFEDMDCPADEPGVTRTARPGAAKPSAPASQPVGGSPASHSPARSGQPDRSGSEPEPALGGKSAGRKKASGKKSSQKKATRKKASKKSTAKKAGKKSAGKRSDAGKSTGSPAVGESTSESAGTQSAPADQGGSNRDD